MMYSFIAADWFYVKSHGDVATFNKDQFPKDLWEPFDLKGLTVLIDGVEYVVKGVEAFAIARSPRNPYRLGFGLLIGERRTVPS